MHAEQMNVFMEVTYLKHLYRNILRAKCDSSGAWQSKSVRYEARVVVMHECSQNSGGRRRP
jgi:hypothetical protein